MIRLDVDSPPGPFFSAKGELHRVGGVWRVKVGQVRLVEHELLGLAARGHSIYFGGSNRSNRCPRGNGFDESHVGVRVAS